MPPKLARAAAAAAVATPHSDATASAAVALRALCAPARRSVTGMPDTAND